MQEEVRVQESTAGVTGKGLSSLQQPFCCAALLPRPARRRFCAPEGRRMHKDGWTSADLSSWLLLGLVLLLGSAAQSYLSQGCSETSSQFREFPPSFLYASPFLNQSRSQKQGWAAAEHCSVLLCRSPQHRTCSPALLLVGNQINSWHSSLAWPCSFYSLLLS